MLIMNYHSFAVTSDSFSFLKKKEKSNTSSGRGPGQLHAFAQWNAPPLNDYLSMWTLLNVSMLCVCVFVFVLGGHSCQGQVKRCVIISRLMRSPLWGWEGMSLWDMFCISISLNIVCLLCVCVSVSVCVCVCVCVIVKCQGEVKQCFISVSPQGCQSSLTLTCTHTHTHTHTWQHPSCPWPTQLSL